MAAASLLIDGYNLLHAAGLARDHYGPGDLQRARQQLLRFLVRHLSHAELATTTLVFDARDPPAALPHRWVIQGVQVFFAPPEDDGDADAFIEALLERHPQPRQVTLISSDHRLQQAARGRGAVWADSDAFVERLTSRKSAAGARREKREAADARRDAPLTAGEVAEWLAVFGDPQPVDAISPRSHRVSPADAGSAAQKPPAQHPPQSTPSQSTSSQSTSSQSTSSQSTSPQSRLPMPRESARPRRQRRGRPPAPHVPPAAEQAAPRPSSGAALPPFSVDWLQALQEWVDEQQRRDSRSRG